MCAYAAARPSMRRSRSSRLAGSRLLGRVRCVPGRRRPVTRAVPSDRNVVAVVAGGRRALAACTTRERARRSAPGATLDVSPLRAARDDHRRPRRSARPWASTRSRFSSCARSAARSGSPATARSAGCSCPGWRRRGGSRSRQTSRSATISMPRLADGRGLAGHHRGRRARAARRSSALTTVGKDLVITR